MCTTKEDPMQCCQILNSLCLTAPKKRFIIQNGWSNKTNPNCTSSDSLMTQYTYKVYPHSTASGKYWINLFISTLFLPDVSLFLGVLRDCGQFRVFLTCALLKPWLTVGHWFTRLTSFQGSVGSVLTQCECEREWLSVSIKTRWMIGKQSRDVVFLKWPWRGLQVSKNKKWMDRCMFSECGGK